MPVSYAIMLRKWKGQYMNRQNELIIKRLDWIQNRLVDMLALAANAARDDCSQQERHLLQKQLDALKVRVRHEAEQTGLKHVI